jgi:glycosyltransferase involved in cell wall biosynthesis
LHVVHVIYYLDIGGGEVFLRGITRALASRGVVQHVFTVGSRGRLADEIEAAGIPVVAFNKSSRAGLVTIVRMAVALRRLRPTIVQTHGEAGLFWGVPAARLAGAQVVSLLYQTREETPLKTFVTQAALRLPTRVIAGSRAAAAFTRERFHVAGEHLRTIHCGIEPLMFDNIGSRDRRQAEWPVLVTVGRLFASKGHRVLIDAFTIVRRHYPNARLVIVGDGPERNALERQAADTNVLDAVMFAGTLYPTVDVLATADVFVFPSLNEPQGLALLEAYAAGVPVVASRTGGIVEMLEHEVDGLLVDPHDAPGLAAAVERFIEDEALRSTCVAHARSRLRAFDVETLAEEYLDVYRAVEGPVGP